MADYAQEKAEFEQLRNDNITLDQIADPEDLQDRLYKMIDYSIKRQDWYEDQKQKVLQIGLAILGSSAAFAALVAKLTYDNNIGTFTSILAWLFVISVFTTGLLIIHQYTNTIQQKHPYRPLVDIRSWFFKYNLQSDHPASLSKDANKSKEQVSEIVKGFDTFLKRWMEFATLKNRFIKEDLEQVFILQLLQKYRSEQLRHMSKTLYRGIVTSSILLVLTIVSLFITKLITKEDNSKPTLEETGVKPTDNNTITSVDSTQSDSVGVKDSAKTAPNAIETTKLEKTKLDSVAKAAQLLNPKKK